MVIARIKGLKISQADERHNPTGEEMIPFQDGSKNGRIRMADFKGMALHVLNTKGTLTEQDLTELQDAINVGKVIFIPNKDNTGLKVVTEVSTKDHVIHLESPDYELEANSDKISKVWFDTVDIDTSTKQVTRSTRETTALKTKGSKTDVLTANGSYTPINEIALVKVNFKTGEVTKAYDLTSTGITFRDDETPSVHWEVEKDGDALFMNLKIDKATQTLDGLMSKEDKYNIDVTIPGDIDALNKRCNRLRKSINQTKEALQQEVDTRTKEVARLDGKINDEAEHREHGDAELKALLNKETEDRIKGDSTFQERLESAKNELDRKYESKTGDLETKLSKEITDRTEADNTAKKLFDEFKAQKGKNGGLAELGSDGKIPAAQLPSYVDDVKEFVTKEGFPNIGETGIIYVDTTTNLTYRWSGTEYVEISQSLALGETNSTAFPGNRGKALEDKLKNQPNTIVTALTDPTEEESQVKINYEQVTKNDSGYSAESPQSVTIPAATTTHAGVMTADDKKKYDGLDSRITTEHDRAVEAEEKLRHDLEDAESESNKADQALRQEIEKERTERQNAIDAEKNRATQKENQLDSEIDAETSRAETKENELQKQITQEKNDRTTIDTQLQQKNESQDTEINKLKEKDQTHDSKLSELESKLTSTTNNPISLTTSGSGNTVKSLSLNGKTLTATLENRVDLTTTQTISGDKTFNKPVKIEYGINNSGLIVKRSTDNAESSIAIVSTQGTPAEGVRWVLGSWNNKKDLQFWKGVSLADKSGTGSTVVSFSDTGDITANKFIKKGGNSDQFLLADGSTANKSDYALNSKFGEYVTLGTSQTISGVKTFTEQTVHQKGFVASAASRITSVSDITSLAQGDGALMVSGGVGIQKRLMVGSTSQFTGQATFSSRIIVNNGIKATVGSASTATDWTNSGVFAGADTYPLVLYFGNGTVNKRILYFATSEKKDAFNICLADDANRWFATGLSIFNNGDVEARHNLSVDGKVGIGTPSPDAKLHVLGNAYIKDALTVNNSVTATHFYKSSDIRLKTNVKQLSYTLEQICAIPTISFDLDDKHQIGTTAQGLEELGFNELVYEEDTRKSTLSNTEGFKPFEKNGEEYVKVKKVEYDTLSILALEGVKLLRDEIEKLKAEIETLKSKCYE